MIKRYFITFCLGLGMYSSHSQVAFYLGLRAGAGAMITQNELNNFGTSSGIRNVVNSSNGWSLHGKAEALVGFWRVRLGYQFLYNFGSPSVISNSGSNELTANQLTTYFNNSQTHFFGQYFFAILMTISLQL